MFEMFDQQYTRHSRISENLKRIDVQQKYTMDTRYDDWGLGFINQSRIFKLVQKTLKLKGFLLMISVMAAYLLIYSMVTPYFSNLLLIAYALLQTVYEIQRQKETKKQLLIFWLIFSADILIENYFARDHFTMVRYLKFLLVHISFMYRLKIISLLLQVVFLLITQIDCVNLTKSTYTPQKRSYFK